MHIINGLITICKWCKTCVELNVEDIKIETTGTEYCLIENHWFHCPSCNRYSLIEEDLNNISFNNNNEFWKKFKVEQTEENWEDFPRPCNYSSADMENFYKM